MNTLILKHINTFSSATNFVYPGKNILLQPCFENMLFRKETWLWWTNVVLVSAFVFALPLKSGFVPDFIKKAVQFQTPVSASKKTEKPGKVTSQAADNKQKTQNQEQPVLKVAYPETVTPFADIHLSPAFFLNFFPVFPRLLPETRFSTGKPLFRLSYFENTFCHHIAINAP